MLRGDGVAVLGLAVLLGILLQAAGRNLAEVDVASLELTERGVRVLLDGEVHAVDLGRVAVVVVELHDVDVLAGLPLAVHLEGAVADRGEQEAVGVVHGGLGHRGQTRVAEHSHEVAHRGGEGDLEGLLVHSLHAGELRGLAVDHVLVAGDGGQVVADLARGLHLGIEQALPAALEGSGVDLVTVVEGGVLQGEGVGQTVLGNRVALGRGVGPLVLLEVPVDQGVEEDLADLGALGLLQVVGVDGNRVVDVEHQGVASGGGVVGSGATGAGGSGLLLAARGKRGQRARGEGAAHERTTGDLGFSHAILLKMNAFPRRLTVAWALPRRRLHYAWRVDAHRRGPWLFWELTRRIRLSYFSVKKNHVSFISASLPLALYLAAVFAGYYAPSPQSHACSLQNHFPVALVPHTRVSAGPVPGGRCAAQAYGILRSILRFCHLSKGRGRRP